MTAVVSGYVSVHVRLQQPDFPLRVALIQSNLHGKPQVNLSSQLTGHRSKGSAERVH